MGSNRVQIVMGDGEPLSTVPRETLASLLREHGAVLFRGFDVDTDAFRGFAFQVGHNFYNMALAPRYREMVTRDGVIGGVLKGSTALPLHMERGYSPFKPELVMFHVLQPAPVGGETLLCSGERVLEEMSPALADIFRTTRLKYRHMWEPEAWQSRYGATTDEVLAKFSQCSDVADAHFDGEVLHYTYVVSAIVRSRLGGGDGFLNNLEGAWELQHAKPETRRAAYLHEVGFEDDSIVLTQEVIDGVHAAVVRATETHATQPGDVVLIDNFRFMHARTAFEGPRVMHAILADANLR